MNFSYMMGYASAPMLCSRDTFKTLVSSPAVKTNIEAFRHGDEKAKKRLPAFCFHSTFKANKRLNADAVTSGLVMVDIDHATDEEMKRYVEKAMPRPEEAATTEVMLIHITPSGKGLRFVIKATSQPGYEQCSSISDYQQVFAQKIGASLKLDTVTDDPARLSFCPRQEDILYLNDRLWTDEPERTTFGQPFFQKGRAPTPPGPSAVSPSQQHTYKGLSLTKIFDAYFAHTGGLPEEGERNSRFYEAARTLRYICDFNPAVIAAHLPEVGLTKPEVFAVCQNACQSVRSAQMPEVLRQIVDELQHADEEEEELEEVTEAESLRVKRLNAVIPPLFKRFTSLYPGSFLEAIVLALLPIIGTLATRLRAKYFIDGETHSPSFMTMVTAEQASGKSFTRRLMQVLMRTIYEEDRANHELERVYREQLKQCKNKQKQPEKPKIKVRIVPPSVSVAKLLERMDLADGEHLMSFAEELDTVIKSNAAGAWSQKTDMYRQAFDNSEYGQDYMSENSYSVTLPIFYNMLFCGTPRQTERFFNDVENGLVSRFCFAWLPDQFGAGVPHFGRLSEQDTVYVDDCVKKLRQAEGWVDLDFLGEPMLHWLEQQVVLSVKDNDRARDIFRKRAAVIGFRAALAVSPLYRLDTEGARQKLTDFALCIADVVLHNQLKFAGKILNEVLEGSPTLMVPKVLLKSVYDALPERFHTEDLRVLLVRRGHKSPVKTLTYRWKKNGLIEATSEPHVYKKILLP